ncbi:MAG: ComF family protein [Clostridia bacterium]|nr:ComF family protein [Clostridia bacterium]
MARLSERMHSAVETLKDILYPAGTNCLVCGDYPGNRLICRDCLDALEGCRIREPRCENCGGPLEGRLCPRCVSGWRIPGTSLWSHRDAARKLVEQLKFNRVELAAEAMGPMLAKEAERLRLPEDTVVTWVPMRPDRLKRRGIDHAGELAEQTARAMNLRCDCLLDNMSPESAKAGGQVHRGREERISRDLRYVAKGVMPAHVLLVDDVMTTGATCLAAASALLAGGAEVRFLTATRTPKY